MTQIDFYFDPISPYAYLAFEHMPQALEGCSYHVVYRPVLLAGLLQHWGQKGPAEIEPKRDWTFRQIAWIAHRHGIELQCPAVHPFNPLTLLRLLLASAPEGITPSRLAVETVFRHVWRGSLNPNEPERLAALAQSLQPLRDPQSAGVKTALRLQTDAAIARGVFGVPSFCVEGRLFWGFDALSMLAACLRGDSWFDADHWAELGKPVPGIQR